MLLGFDLEGLVFGDVSLSLGLEGVVGHLVDGLARFLSNSLLATGLDHTRLLVLRVVVHLVLLWLLLYFPLFGYVSASTN